MRLAETMLLVDDGVREVLVFLCFFLVCLRVVVDRYLAVRNPLRELRTRNFRRLFVRYLAWEFTAFATRNKADGDRMVFEVGDEGREVLFCEDFSRAHIR